MRRRATRKVLRTTSIRLVFHVPIIRFAQHRQHHCPPQPEKLRRRRLRMPCHILVGMFTFRWFACFTAAPHHTLLPLHLLSALSPSRPLARRLHLSNHHACHGTRSADVGLCHFCLRPCPAQPRAHTTLIIFLLIFFKQNQIELIADVLKTLI